MLAEPHLTAEVVSTHTGILQCLGQQGEKLHHHCVKNHIGTADSVPGQERERLLDEVSSGPVFYDLL